MKTKAIFILIGNEIQNDISLTYKSFDINIGLISKEIEKEIDIINNNENTYLSVTGESNRENLLEVAQNIKNLFSLAYGKRIIFNKQVYVKDEENEQVTKEMSAPINEGQQIIPDYIIVKFFEQTLIKYASFSKKDKNLFFAVTDYLNQTKHGFIEDRVLHTAIAWESLAEHFNINTTLPPHLYELRLELKKSYNEWRQKYKKFDPKGELGSRIFAAVDHEKLINKLINLTKKFKLNYDLLNIDFHKLKELRDMVAHTGRINIQGSLAYEIMDPAIRGLQIILLSWLGYSGLIYSHKNGWKTMESIENFYTAPDQSTQ